MEFDFSEFFTKYEAIAAEADAAFNRVKQDHPDAVTCGQGCSDCCYALFDLTLIEALYLKDKFSEKLDPPTRSAVMERADEAERENYKLKRKVFKASQEGKAAMEILAEVAKMRIRCPLLDNEDNCELYEHRPITCRLYGIPMAMSGESHICGETAFEPGKQYPTANMDGFQEKLLALSQELVASLNTRHV
ncbi:MAG: YkgJ family cysteine cluster protein, partial [Desulfovibrio sp.]